MARVYVFFVVYSAGAGEEELSTETFSEREFLADKGGCLSDATIQKLIDAKVPIIVMDNSNYKTLKKPVRMEYQDDIDIPEFKEIPTYKRMCVCILKNDHACKYMGFSPTKEEMSKRSQIMEQYRIIVS